MPRPSATIALACALLAAPVTARASGMWLSKTDISADELRVAIAASPGRTTVWTALAFDSWPTDLALVLPVPPGTMVDLSPDAWFDALDQATAPRILTSSNLLCPDGSQPPGVDTQCVAIAEQVGPVASIPAVSVDLLDDLAAVTTWANDHDMAIPASIAPNLALLSASRFVAVRFIVPPPGGGVTQTVRVVMPGVSPKLALSLFDPGHRAPIVTTYLIGEGAGTLSGATQATLDGSLLPPGDCYTNNYDGLLYELLQWKGTSLVQAASHEVWAAPVSGDPAAQFDSILDAYFHGATSPGSGSPDPTTCTWTATATVESHAVLREACPAAAEGTVDGGAACTTPTLGQHARGGDPSILACGQADDVAIAFSGLVPAEVWVTRESLYLGELSDVDYPVTFAPGSYVEPIVYASLLQDGWCPAGTGGGPAAPSQSSGCNGDGVDAAAQGCGAAADGLSALGDIGDCSVSRPLHRRSAWPLVMGIAAMLAPMRRRARRRR